MKHSPYLGRKPRTLAEVTSGQPPKVEEPKAKKNDGKKDLPRPRKLSGVKVQPRWQWSKSYALHYGGLMRKDQPTRDSYRNTAAAYARWLAKRAGVDLDKANHSEPVWSGSHIAAVRFAVVSRDWRGDLIEREEIATIDIPNFDWQPTVSITTLRELPAIDLRQALETMFA